MDPILNKDEEDYDPMDPGTWYTASQLALEYYREKNYEKAATIYYYMVVNCGNTDTYSWLCSTGIVMEGEKDVVIANIVTILSKE